MLSVILLNRFESLEIFSVNIFVFMFVKSCIFVDIIREVPVVNKLEYSLDETTLCMVYLIS